MTNSNMNPLILTNAIVVNMKRSMIILTGILFFNTVPCYYLHDTHDDVHEKNNLYRNL